MGPHAPYDDTPPLSRLSRVGPLLATPGCRDTKDPCPVFDGKRWHIFGSAGSSWSERWRILHATARRIEGPWRRLADVELRGLAGDHVAAPGVVHDGARLHMFVQTDFHALGGAVEHLVSDDDGASFTLVDRALDSLPAPSPEAGIYDPHPAEIDGECYLVYSANAVVGSPDIFLARSTSRSWDGPWERLGVLLDHDHVEHHNQRGQVAYEWGLEGAQLVGLPDGRVLLVAVCFLPAGGFGTRQRVFFALADDVRGPYVSIGPVLPPPRQGWDCGENGHAAAVIRGERLWLFFQGRREVRGGSGRWRYGLASFYLPELDAWPAAPATSRPLSRATRGSRSP